MYKVFTLITFSTLPHKLFNPNPNPTPNPSKEVWKRFGSAWVGCEWRESHLLCWRGSDGTHKREHVFASVGIPTASSTLTANFRVRTHQIRAPATHRRTIYTCVGLNGEVCRSRVLDKRSRFQKA